MRPRGACSYILSIVLALALARSGRAGAADPVRVAVDRTPIVFEGQPPIERGGRVLVPLRGVLERLGAYVGYDNQTKTVTALRDATNITLPVGSRHALVGDRAVTLDVPAFIVSGSVLVPLRFLSEALGAQVAWDSETRTVTIDTGAGGLTAEGTASPATRDPARITTTGVVTAVYADLAPRRLVVRVPAENGAPAREKTIPLRPEATVSVLRADTLIAISLDRVKVGDTVEVRQNGEGVATAVEVVARAPAKPVSRTPVSRTPVSRTPVSRTPVARGRAVFKGEFLEAKRARAGAWVLKMTDGRLVEVSDKAVVLYGDKKIAVDDLRSGDQVTVAIDPKTGRATRVVVAVEK